MQLGMIGLGPDGRQHGAAAAQGRPPVRGLRQVAQSRWKNWSRRRQSGASSLQDLVKKLEQAAGDLVDGPGGSRGRDHRVTSCPISSPATS